MKSMYGLTRREMETMKLLSEGLQAKEIATKYYRSVDTVKKHISNSYKKMGVRNRVEAMMKFHPEIRISA